MTPPPKPAPTRFPGRPLHVAVVGATGAVGAEMIRLLAERGFPVASLRCLASSRSAGERVHWRNVDVIVEPLTPEAFEGVDLALFSAGASVSREFAPIAVAAGAIVVDNSSAFRMEESVPLVVPEVNAHALANHRGIIANPNCSTIQTVVALAPLHRAGGLRRVVVSTYQSASGAGRRAMDELRDQTIALLNFQPPPLEVFPRELAFDVIPRIDVLLPEGDTREERKMVEESRKILGLPALSISATCARVPVFIGHCVSANVEFERPVSVEDARALFDDADGIELDDDPDGPGPRGAAGQDAVRIGRLRADPSLPYGLNLWIVADNLRKGAATNAVQIAEALLPICPSVSPGLTR